MLHSSTLQLILGSAPPAISIADNTPGVSLLLQEVLHVHVPHYVDMFERIMAGPRPHRFAHIYLPGGSASLGALSQNAEQRYLSRIELPLAS